MKSPKNKTPNKIQLFSYKTAKKFLTIFFLKISQQRSIILPVKKTKNTMLFSKLYDNTTNFAVNSKKSELVRKIFLTNSA